MCTIPFQTVGNRVAQRATYFQGAYVLTGTRGDVIKV